MARGDHLYINCTGYTHHGIDCGDGRVVHFETNMWRKFTSGLVPVAPPRVREESLEDFSRGREVHVRYYDLSDDPDVVLERARSRIGDEGYRLFHNNCEHFAVWCRTGRHESSQVETVKATAKRMGKELVTSALVFRFARRLPLRVRPIAYGAAVAISAASFAAKYVEQRAADRIS